MMEFKDFIAGPDDNDRRLDKVLRKILPNHNLSEVYKFIRKGLVKVNHKKSKAEYKVLEKDVISIPSFVFQEHSEEKHFENKIEKNELKGIITVFKNDFLWIINKPFDECVQGSEKSLDKVIQNIYENEGNGKSLSFKPGPLHRLDRKTTGLLVFSWNLAGARWFSSHIEDHSIKKSYLGIVQGHLERNEDWRDFISLADDFEKSFHTSSVSNVMKDDSKSCVTHAFPLKYGKWKDKELTLVRFDIETGRHHQIRSQSSKHGFPLIGDTAYGGFPLENGKDIFFLHASVLEFPENPLSLPKKIECPLPESFENFLKEYF